MKTMMPEINFEKLTAETREYARAITVNGRLRASKPPVQKIKVPSEKYGYTYEPADPFMGCAAYVWRMVAFQVSPIPKHHCMPACAEFDLPGSFEHRRYLTEELDLIVQEIVDSVPMREWHGIIRWGQAYEQIGTPQIREGGTIVYR